MLLLTISAICWLYLFIRAKRRISQYGRTDIPLAIRGCGGDDEPEYQAPPAPVYKTAEQIYAESIPFGQANYPLAYGARESALADIANGPSYYAGYQDPQITALLKQIGMGGEGAASYYQGFQPTSIEQALGNQYFANVMPDIERSIKQNLSLSGMAYSPILSEQIAEQRGKLGVDIGSYLSNLGNQRATTGINTLGNLFNVGEQRATNALSSRLGIDPYSTFSPYAMTTQNQDLIQQQADYTAALQKAQADYQNAMNEYQKKQSMISSLSTLGGAGLGTGIGALLAVPTGGMSLLAGMGYGALAGGVGGGVASPFWGGGASPVSLTDAISLAQAFPSSQTGKVQSANVKTGGQGGQLFNTSQFGETWSPYSN